MADSTFRLRGVATVQDYKLATIKNRTAADSLKFKIVGAVAYEPWESDWRWSLGDKTGGPHFVFATTPDSWSNDHPEWNSESTGYALSSELSQYTPTDVTEPDPNVAWFQGQNEQQHPIAYGKPASAHSYSVGYDFRSEGCTIYGSPTAPEADAYPSVQNFLTIVADPWRWADSQGRRVLFPKSGAQTHKYWNADTPRATMEVQVNVIVMPVCVVSINTGLNDGTAVKVSIPGLGSHEYKSNQGKVVIGVPRIVPRMDLDPMTRVNLLAISMYGNHSYNWAANTVNINLDGTGPKDVEAFHELGAVDVTLEAANVSRSVRVNSMADDFETSIDFGSGGGAGSDSSDSLPDTADSYGDPSGANLDNFNSFDQSNNNTTENKPTIYLPPIVSAGSVDSIQFGAAWPYKATWFEKTDDTGARMLIGNGGVDFATGETKLTTSDKNQIIGRA